MARGILFLSLMSPLDVLIGTCAQYCRSDCRLVLESGITCTRTVCAARIRIERKRTNQALFERQDSLRMRSLIFGISPSYEKAEKSAGRNIVFSGFGKFDRIFLFIPDFDRLNVFCDRHIQL